jgi:PAS domain S-box-containing protein
MAFNKKLIDARTIDFEHVRQLHSTLLGKYIMDSINITIEKMRAHEQNLLVVRSDQKFQSTQNANYAYMVLLAVTMLTLIVVFVSINRNLHARGLAEKRVVEVSDHIQDIYNNAPCGYHALDEQGVIIEMNKTWLDWIQYSREEVINKLKLTDIMTEESVELFRQKYPAFKKTGIIRDLEFEITRQDKTVFYVMISSVAQYDVKGNYLKSRSTAFDYTDLKKAKEKVMATNMELEAFTYSVSHDLRAPLRSIDGYSRILLEDYGPVFDDNARRVLNVVMNNAHRMGQLIDDLLDFSRIGRKEIARTPINTEQMVRAISDELLLEQTHRTLDFQIGTLPTVWADAHLFKQVWINLLSNALKYTTKQDKACVEVNAQQNEDGDTVFSVRDNGAGFDMKYVHKLFGVFQRLHRAQEFEGTGVGLAIVHRIITRHGGKVWAEGKLNEGAAFYFSIPHANQ